MTNREPIPSKVDPSIFDRADFKPSAAMTPDERGKSPNGAMQRHDSIIIPVGELGVIGYNPYEADDLRLNSHD